MPGHGVPLPNAIATGASTLAPATFPTDDTNAYAQGFLFALPVSTTTSCRFILLLILLRRRTFPPPSLTPRVSHYLQSAISLYSPGPKPSQMSARFHRLRAMDFFHSPHSGPRPHTS